MYSLIAVASPTNVLPLLEQSSGITRLLMPDLGARSATRVHRVPGTCFGWAYLHPERAGPGAIIQEYVSGDDAIVVYGQVVTPNSLEAPLVVRDAWKRGGAEAVRQLEGSFSAIIVDIGNQSLHVVSDMVGQRALRYLLRTPTLVLSTHDLPIVASGLCSLDFDLPTACSITACGWSIGGSSLLEDVEVCDPGSSLSWREGETRVQSERTLCLDERIPVEDSRSCKEQVKRIVATLQANTRNVLDTEPAVEVELTAGVDSRAALGILLSQVERSRVIARTFGERNSLEVSLAREIARRCGIKHVRSQIELSSTEDFLHNADCFAYYVNGASNSKLAFRSPLAYDHEAPVVVGGQGGELFRGSYYRSRVETASQLTERNVRRLLFKKFYLLKKLKWRDKSLAEEVQSRIQRRVDELARISSEPCDILDLFHLLEKVARWSPTDRRAWVRSHTVFTSPSAVRLAYQLPAPIARHCALHHTIIRGLLKRAYWLPINGKETLLFPGHPRLRQAVKKFYKRSAALRSRLRPAQDAQDMESLFAQLMRELLRGPVREILEESNSFGVAMLGRQSLKSLLESHISGEKNRLDTIALLITMERWREQVTAAYRQARAHAGQ